MNNIKVGDTIQIIYMEGEPQYANKVGVVTSINEDPWGDVQVHGTWGGCCLYLGKDKFMILKNEK